MFRNRLKSFGYAFEGIVDVIRNTPNMKVHLFMAAIVLIGGFVFAISTMEWIACTICIALVMSAETFNSAIEYLTDLVSPSYHDLAKKTKDASAGAVLLLSIGTAIVGTIIFLPKVLSFINIIF